jgi:hypothetical protein
MARAHDQLLDHLARTTDRAHDRKGRGPTSTQDEPVSVGDLRAVGESLAHHAEASAAHAQHLRALTAAVQTLHEEIEPLAAADESSPEAGPLLEAIRALSRDIRALTTMEEAAPSVAPILGRLESLIATAFPETINASPPEVEAPSTEPVVRQTSTIAEVLNPDGSRKRMGEILVTAGLLSAGELKTILQEQASTSPRRLGALLQEKGLASSEIIARVVASQLQLEFIAIDVTAIDPTAANLVGSRLAIYHQCVPLSMTEEKVTLAMGNPLDLIALEDVERATNRQVIAVVASADDIEEAIAQVYRPLESLSP